jgi:hypothetical protein
MVASLVVQVKERLSQLLTLAAFGRKKKFGTENIFREQQVKFEI